jgi:hypothetical protein
MILLGMRINRESAAEGQIVINISPEHLECEKGNTLETMQTFIGSVEAPASIGYVQTDINGLKVDVWYNKDFAAAPGCEPSFLANDITLLCGNLVFARADKDGELLGLTDKEIHIICDAYLDNHEKAQNYFNQLVNKA